MNVFAVNQNKQQKTNKPSEREDTILAVANKCAFGAGYKNTAIIGRYLTLNQLPSF